MRVVVIGSGIEGFCLGRKFVRLGTDEAASSRK